MDVAYLLMLVMAGCIVALGFTSEFKRVSSRLFSYNWAKHSRFGIIIASLFSLAIWLMIGLLLVL